LKVNQLYLAAPDVDGLDLDVACARRVAVDRTHNIFDGLSGYFMRISHMGILSRDRAAATTNPDARTGPSGAPRRS
jgi:hypothetical protein